MKVPSKGLRPSSAKIVKSHGADVGSYELKEAGDMKQSIRKRQPSFKFGPNKERIDQEGVSRPVKIDNIVRFTEEVARSKAHVPGVGEYKMEECYKKLSRPPSANLRRR